MNSKIQKLRNHFFLPAFLREMKNLRVGGMSGGNRITLIIDGDSCFREFLKALRSARHSINLESYIFKSDDVGWMIARELAEKAARGIEVNVMYDAVGSLKTSQSIFTFLREHGVEVLAFNP